MKVCGDRVEKEQRIKLCWNVRTHIDFYVMLIVESLQMARPTSQLLSTNFPRSTNLIRASCVQIILRMH
jgi:hypothetical protein